MAALISAVAAARATWSGLGNLLLRMTYPVFSKARSPKAASHGFHQAIF
jgi:hypothetical protein